MDNKIKWKNAALGKALIRRLNASRSTVSHDRDSVLESYRLPVLINANIKFPVDFSFTDRIRIVNVAIFDVSSNSMHYENLLEKIDGLAKATQNQQFETFEVVTAISLNADDTVLQEILPPNCTVTKSMAPEFAVTRDEDRKRLMHQFGVASLPNQYSACVLREKAKTPFRAVEQGLARLNTWRGLLTFLVTRNRETIASPNSRDMLGFASIGPLHTVQDLQGKMACQTVWFEQSYRKPVDTFALGSVATPQFSSGFKIMMNRLDGSREKLWLSECLARYATALDEANLEQAFCKLWALLEELAITSNHEVLIHRVASMRINRNEETAQLKLLREVRNHLVHRDRVNIPLDRLVWLLKGYVDSMLGLHLKEDFQKFDTKVRADYLELLCRTNLLIDEPDLSKDFEKWMKQIRKEATKKA
jgi:hypothetical protein